MQNKINQRQQLQRSSTFRVLTVIAGALLAAVGLELFLMPHGLVVGGITGLSALFAHTTEMQLGLFLFLFNLPFIFMSRKQVNLRFALYTVLGLTCLTIASLALHRFPAVISDPLPAAMAGGICLGVGIGISVRFGGVNKQASDQGYSLLSGGPPKSTEVVIMILNCAILLLQVHCSVGSKQCILLLPTCWLSKVFVSHYGDYPTPALLGLPAADVWTFSKQSQPL